MFSWLLVQILILFAALVLDMFLGEPPAPVHPVVWMGGILTILERGLYVGTDNAQRLKGAALAVGLIVTFTVPVVLFQWLGYQVARGNVALLLCYVGLSAYLLKASFTIFTLQKEAVEVTDLAYTDIDAARMHLRALVSRERSHLDRESILSSVCESVGENTVDSIVSPLLFFAVFGVAGALCYRVVNTLDAMLGYRDHRRHVGLFSARLDDVFNYLPTRLAIVPMLLGFRMVSGKSAGDDAWNVLKTDRHKKPAVNSGIPVALFAGGLGVKLMKPSSYEIGDGTENITKATVNRALSVMLITSMFTVSLAVLLLYGRALT
ncbi:MAG TPA: adenosylcobinamide-phosphate synthase CbiB [Candidatus Bathyarchaeia archaeon]|nr:adenosylcobinamide-phosphate synthase CbiB [Candidatus Bathyarchaeia archaeon]